MTGRPPSSAEVPPLPGGAEDLCRRAESRDRRRIATGRWLPVLQERIGEHFGSIRATMLGRPTLSRNLTRSVAQKISRLYDAAPSVGVDGSPVAADALLGLAARAGMWEMGQQHQQRTVLIREGVRRVDVVGDGGSRQLQIRCVDADSVYVEAASSAPEEPVLVVEAMRRRVGSGRAASVQWCWDVFDISDSARPEYKIALATSISEGGHWSEALRDGGDLTEQILGVDTVGPAYPYRFSDGRPFVPYEITHAQRTGRLWDPYEWSELVEAGLDVAMLWTFWLHSVKDASWPQRWALNARAVGGVTEGLPDGQAVSRVEPDPTVLLQFTARPGEQVLFGQWQPGVDPERLELALSSFEEATVASLGLGTTDVQRSGDGRSGYAIELDQKAVRRLQRQFAPMFAASDAALLAKAAALTNTNGLTSGAPESGYSVTYPSLDLSASERDAAAVELKALVDSGLSPGPIATIQALRQVSREQALALYRQWRQDAADVAAIDAETAQGAQTSALGPAVEAAIQAAIQRIAGSQT